jgi:hypothetical protein
MVAPANIEEVYADDFVNDNKVNKKNQDNIENDNGVRNTRSKA